MSARREIEELLPQVMRLAPSCPEPVAISYLREAARQLCAALPIWRDVDCFTVSHPQYELLSTIGDAEIINIESASLNGSTLKPVALAYLDGRVPGWYSKTEAGPARYLTQLGPDSVSLYPRASGELSMRLLLRPSTTALTFPAALVNQHAETVGRGALGRVLSMPNAEWSNPGLAAAHLAFFESKTNTAAQRKAIAGQQNAPVRTKASFF